MSDNLILWGAIIGFFLPIGIAVVQKASWPSAVKAIIAFLVCLIVAAVEVYLKGQINTTDYVTAALVILVSSIAFYKGFWQPTGVAPTIETKVLG